MIDVSIIVPVYNANESYFRRCLDSLIHQTYQNIEILLVDDGSVNQCPVICDEYSKEDRRVKSVHQKNQGVSAARNHGMEMASGKWLMFVDADDWLELNACEKLMQAVLTEEPELLFFHLFHDYENRAIRGSYGLQDATSKSDSDERYEFYAHTISPYVSGKKLDVLGYACNKLVLREFILTHQIAFPRDIGIGEDVVFTLSCCRQAERIKVLSEWLYHYRQSESSVNYKYNIYAGSERFSFWNAMRDFLDGLPQPLPFSLMNAYYIKVLGGACGTLGQFYFRSENPQSMKQKFDSGKAYLRDDRIQEALTKAAIRDIPLSQRIQFLLVKKGCLRLYYLLWTAKKRAAEKTTRFR